MPSMWGRRMRTMKEEAGMKASTKVEMHRKEKKQTTKTKMEKKIWKGLRREQLSKVHLLLRMLLVA
jgi:very-short-patch-repair endonuclease